MGWHDNEQLAKQTLHRIMRHHVKPISSRKWSLIYNGVWRYFKRHPTDPEWCE